MNIQYNQEKEKVDDLLQEKESIWTKSFISLSFINLSVFIVFYGLVAALPLYAIGVLNKTDQQAGLLMTIFLSSAILIRPFTGKILDMFGKKRMLWISLVCYTACTILYYFIHPFGWLLLLRFFNGLWFSLLTTAGGTIAAHIVPFNRRGAGLGYYNMSMNLAVVLGPMIVLPLIQYFSFDVMFIVLSLLVIVSSFFPLSLPSFPPVERLKTNKRSLSFDDLFERKAMPVALLACLVGFSYSSVLSYLSLFAQWKGLLDMTSTFFLVFAIIMLLARPLTGRMFDERGPQSIIYPGLICFMIGLVLLAYTNSVLIFLLAAGFVGLGYGSIVPSLQTLAVQTAPIERSGYATATFFTFFDIGIATGAYIFGVIAVAQGYRMIYLVSSIVIGLVLILFLLRNHRKNRLRQL